MIIGICDDEQIYTDLLQYKITDYMAAKQISDFNLITFTDSVSLLNNIIDVDILFLDIDMETPDAGIQIKNQISAYNTDIRIIFVTSHFELVEDAFGRNVYGFLQKKDIDSKMNSVLDAVLQNYDFTVLHLKDINGIAQNIKPLQIKCIESRDKYTDVYIRNEKLVFRKTLQEWQQCLPVGQFCTASRCCIINFNYLQGSIMKWDLSIDDKPIKIPKGRRKTFKNAYMLYMRDR